MTKQEEIQKLKEEKDAVILAHYYVRPEIQEIADFIGDSYFLSKKAVSLPYRMIVFAGVSFMGESAKLLNPSKTVLMPDAEADCPMAHMVVKETIDKARAQYEDLAVVCYINSTAKIKSWSDVSVTSANAVQIVRNLPNKNILFIPDRNLAHFVAEQVPEKQFVFNEGYCPIHENMRAAEIQRLKDQHPSASVLVHPECNQEVLALADYIGSTSGIIQFAKESTDKEFIIGTESGVQYALQQAREDAVFYFPETEPVCTDMKRITLDKIIDVLKRGGNEISMDNGQADEAARQTLTRMLELAK
ncbi:MAG: quinolinate synthase NadA [Lachnospiraceae bacterium]|nr:quinolinate synthase NadA [Lachnospiraceae bacterium]